MKLVRRELLQLAGSGAAAVGLSRIAAAQTPPAAGPKLTQILRKDLVAQDHVVQESVVSVVEFAPGTAAPWHMHPGAQEILYVQDGNLTVEVEGQGTATVTTGEAVIIPADVPHLARNDSAGVGAKALVVHSRSAKDKPLLLPVKRAT